MDVPPPNLNPASSKTWGNLGLVQIGLNNLADARESLQHALEIDPTDEIARSTLAQLPK
jgi:Tfp pilus assembly protein PilF